MPAQSTPSQTHGSSGPDAATDHLDGLASAAADKVQEVVAQAGDIARQMAEQSREVGEIVREVTGNLTSAVDKSLKDQPIATLAMAAIIGLALGAVWKASR